ERHRSDVLLHVDEGPADGPIEAADLGAVEASASGADAERARIAKPARREGQRRGVQRRRYAAVSEEGHVIVFEEAREASRAARAVADLSHERVREPGVPDVDDALDAAADVPEHGQPVERHLEAG